jgi:hypothetical protein
MSSNSLSVKIDLSSISMTSADSATYSIDISDNGCIITLQDTWISDIIFVLPLQLSSKYFFSVTESANVTMTKVKAIVSGGVIIYIIIIFIIILGGTTNCTFICVKDEAIITLGLCEFIGLLFLFYSLIFFFF